MIMENLTEKKARFIELLTSTHREGVEHLIEVIDSMGFFTAPASSRFHKNHEGGLLEHSLNVCDVALELREAIIKMKPEVEPKLTRESIIIAALLHDVCKADLYKPTVKKMKNKEGQWVDTNTYEVDHGQFPFGHGEKSVIVILMNGMKLTTDEALAIRWHMNAWDLPFQSPDIKGNINQARQICPLLQLIIAADGLASHILEVE